MNQEIQRWSNRYDELKIEKTKLEKDTENLLMNIENNHIKAGIFLHFYKNS